MGILNSRFLKCPIDEEMFMLEMFFVYLIQKKQKIIMTIWASISIFRTLSSEITDITIRRTTYKRIRVLRTH
ncbi:hypothetical protein SNEBB_001663 [Seison nebaliae]|nr:hypothetical protein SNEBB_001663 [Seison nebaliae]